MDVQTSGGPKSSKFYSNDTQIELQLDQYEQELKVRLTNLKNRSVYQAVYDQSTLPRDLKMFLTNIKTVYNYIEVNKANTQKITIQQETGKIHLFFMLSFGPNSQITKQIILQTELKQIGKVQGSNIKQNFDLLREELKEMKTQNQDQRKKLKNIISMVQKTNQRLVIESQSLKLSNIQFKNRLNAIEQKVDSLQYLLKDLYTQFQNFKEQRQKKDTEANSIKTQNKSEGSEIVIPQQCLEKIKFKKKLSQANESTSKQSELRVLKKLDQLQQERDQEKKQFQQNLQQKQRLINQKINKIDNHQTQSTGDDNPFEMKILSSYLKDSQIQYLKNAVTSSSEIREEKQSKQQQKKNLNFSGSDFSSNSSIKSGLTRKIGINGKYYCGGKLCTDNCVKCKGTCGPNTGQNCQTCMKLDIQRRGLKRGFLINGNGQVCWIQKGHYCCGIGCQKGSYNCGLSQKYCKWCNSITQNYQHRYKSCI